MPSFGLIAVVSFGLSVAVATAADATSPVDYTQRNTPFAPGTGITTQKQTPATNASVQEKRVDKTLVEKETSSLNGQRASIDVQEAREKKVREKDSRRPEATEHKTSAFNHRPSSISTRDDTNKPPTVAKYQDSLAAASASNMARFPAMEQATTAKINRFVFRKNPAESGPLTDTRVTPAAGGSPLSK